MGLVRFDNPALKSWEHRSALPGALWAGLCHLQTGLFLGCSFLLFFVISYACGLLAYILMPAAPMAAGISKKQSV